MKKPANVLSRRHFMAASAALGVTTSLAPRSFGASTADDINVGFISCGGRAIQLMRQFSEVNGVNIAGLCDTDQNRLERVGKQYPKAQQWKDLRDLIASDSIDVVVVATCNHWHCLATIWAMEAGKDVYVEKPLSHSQWEGRQTVNAARKYNRVCQIGTQQRSDPMQAEIKQFLHEEKALGEIKSARVNRYGIRRPIGKTDTPLSVDSNVDYDLWLGPAQDQPIYRPKLHYDWHWNWNTGSGEMGNWGVHVLDDVRNNVFQDSVALPHRILGGGGRVSWEDAGETPNVHFTYFDTGSIPVVIGLTNLAIPRGGKTVPEHPGPGSGYIAYCEGGELRGSRGAGIALDKDGKTIKTFTGTGGNVQHQANFIDAVRSRDSSMLNADVAVGNDSTGWCNLANISVRAGEAFSAERAEAISLDKWNELLGQMGDLVQQHGLELTDDAIKLSPMLELDAATEQFVGDNAEVANAMLKREYRKGYEVPEISVG
ncbi:4-carboxy-2-hydroxymuconate-6-semialdehyde dehydrogenase [Rubripirellula obstinata]|uniref:4-carboxy-2-hydroxymuconate-6-semialdehyde dehydrogenase n=1 Tax=Rubripirellula obstinata TaxID=406547 RepID=A0A5B1CSP5_9BACT|nr:Gfo/Idh/MocA family oxidoreductase [Rubripirellula obstinata]KAA1262433.1 4-carboxy-2-hydroxymuconate-6-semialdehyde dehydrogenase [Rubripirellula obstinata]